MALSNEVAFDNTSSYSNYIASKIAAIEERMQKLSLAKEHCSSTIRTTALGHLDTIPRVSHLQRQQELHSALLGKLAAVFEKDTYANDVAKNEIASTEEARNTIIAEDETLSGQMASLKKEIEVMSRIEEETGELITSCKEAQIESGDLLMKLKAELSALYESIPDEACFEKCAEDLATIDSEIVDLRQQDLEISPVLNDLANALRSLERTHREEIEAIENASTNNNKVVQDEMQKVQDETFQAEFLLKSLLPKRDKFKRMLLQSQPGKSLDQLEEELQASESELTAEYQRLERQLEVEKEALAKTKKEVEEFLVKMEDSDEIVITDPVPTAPGLAPFSPETIRKREDRKKHQHREVVHSLRYSDISTDLNDNDEPLLTGRAKISGQAVKRTLKELTAKEPSPQKMKRRDVPLRAATQVAGKKQSCVIRESHLSFDQESLNNSPVKEVFQPRVAPPPAFMDDSLFESDVQDESMDSFFAERPVNNVRCIPENIFLESDPSLEINTSPPGALSDKDENETSLDQSVWD